MGKKGDFFAPKAIANRMKAKGLQKLRWYCQACQKQCRDENGFKCHVMTEGHQRQMMLFNKNARQIVDTNSEEFQHGFVELLRTRYGTRRVYANDVYREFISDRHHLHMNATKWNSLTEFVKHLGREGICVVDETERGWFLRWVDTSPAMLAKQDAVKKMERLQKDQETRDRLLIQEQIERGKQAKLELVQGQGQGKEEYTEWKRDGSEKIAISLEKVQPKKTTQIVAASSSSLKRRVTLDDEEEDSKSFGEHKEESVKASAPFPRIFPPSTSTAIPSAKKQRQEETEASPAVAPPEDDEEDDHPWILPGLVVKNQNATIGNGKYLGQKGVIRSIHNDYVAEVELLDGSGDRIRVDQEQLETVIPAIGGRVTMVKGPHAGKHGTLLVVHVDDFCATIELEDTQQRLDKVDYEWFSKLAADND